VATLKAIPDDQEMKDVLEHIEAKLRELGSE
jgi:hypothetical protein